MGADAGFASIIGLAVLVLLYFAQARETASLREQAEQAGQRVAQLESRLAQVASVQSSAAAVAPAPGIQPRPGVVAAPGFPSGPAMTVVSPAPPAGVAAPPLSAATKLIPTPPGLGIAGAAAARIAASGRPVAAPAPAPGPAAPVAPASSGATPPGATPAAATPAGATPAGATPASATPASARPASPPFAAATPAGARPASRPFAAASPPSPPPMNRIVTPRPATAAGGATTTNGTGERPMIPPPEPVPSRPPVHLRAGGGGGGRGGARPGMLADLGGHGDSPGDLTRVLTALAAVAVVAAIVIVLLSVTSGGTTARSTSTATPPVSNTPTTHRHPSAPKTATINPASVSVAVLNGTAVYHLANSIGMQLAAAGFKVPPTTITNASTQTQPNTTVEYGPGYERDAAAVARTLKVSSSSVQPLTTATQQTLGCPQTTSCTVVVTVGADLVNTQTTTTG